MDIHNVNGLRHFGVIDFAKKKITQDSHTPLKSNIIICRGCDLLLGYHSFLRERRKNFLMMHALLNYKINSSEFYDMNDIENNSNEDTLENEAIITFDFVMLFCTGCSGSIGIKYGNTFYIYTEMVRERKRVITAAIIALKSELTAECESVIKSVNELEQLEIDITIHHFVLQKSQLQKFKLQYSYDVCIIIHKQEGRLLLFDCNGLYDTVFRECFSNSQGNVLLILILSPEHVLNTNSGNNHNFGLYNKDKDSQNSKSIVAKSSICDKLFLQEIAVNGKQPLLAMLSKNQLIMTIFEQQINTFQIEFLASFLHNSQSKPMLPNDLINYLKFFKRYSRIDVTDSQEALLSFFVDKADENPQLTNMVNQLKDYFILMNANLHYQFNHSNRESSDENDEEGYDEVGKNQREDKHDSDPYMKKYTIEQLDSKIVEQRVKTTSQQKKIILSNQKPEMNKCPVF